MHGYNANAGYSFGFYQEATPSWLHWAALNQGHETPTSGFRYLDAGCGQGFALILSAACHPDSEFVGVDFSPTHIAHAKNLAKKAGLENVRFLEGDFKSLRGHSAELGEFDYVVCHGITSWVSAEVRQALFELVGQLIKSGGLFYNSYNTLPGWLEMMPFQKMVSLNHQRTPGMQAIDEAITSINTILSSQKGFQKAYPKLAERLATSITKDPSYLLHEYNNQSWTPFFVSDMIKELQTHKLDYLGSANLNEATDLGLHPSVVELMAKQQSSCSRELIRDIATMRTFRRDLYVKGQRKPWLVEQSRLLAQQKFMLHPLTAPPDHEVEFLVSNGSEFVKLDHDLCSTILRQFLGASSGLTAPEVAYGIPNVSIPQVTDVICVLLSNGFLCFHNDTFEPRIAAKLNYMLAAEVCMGAPYSFVCAPRAGGAIPMSEIDWQVIHLINQMTTEQKQALKSDLSCIELEHWANSVALKLVDLGIGLSKDGKAITEATKYKSAVKLQLEHVITNKLPAFHKLGVVS